MGQMTIYLDDDTIREIEEAAQREKVSISRWVKARVRKSLQGEWPEGYFEKVFGALKEVDLERPEQPPFSVDRPRPEL